MYGKFFGVGVGPGDPELMTLKAVRIIENADVIAFPQKNNEQSQALKIAGAVCKNLEKKELLPIYMPMTKDEALLKKSHAAAASEIEGCLLKGKSVAFLTLGDPSIYSTYIYIHKRILKLGYEAEMISGITSFCASGAKLNISLAEKDELLHIVPASYSLKKLPEILALPGNKILMKSGKKLAAVRKEIKKAGLCAKMVENCGMENERIYNTSKEIPDTAGYYSLIVVKDSFLQED